MSIEVINAGITFHEEQLATVQDALAFVLAAAKLGIAEPAYNLLEGRQSPLTFGVTFNRAHTPEPYSFELTDTVDNQLAGLLFVGDGEPDYSNFAQIVTGEPQSEEEPEDDDTYGPFYSCEQWPTLVTIHHKMDGIVHAVAAVALHILEDGNAVPEPVELSLLKADSSMGSDRLTIDAMHKFMESLRAE